MALTASAGALSALPAAAASATVTSPPPAPAPAPAVTSALTSAVVPPAPPTTTTTATRPAPTAENSATRKFTKAALQQEKAERAIKVAKKQLGDPYVWGATGPGAFDCSGLVQFAWRKAGVKLPRTTWAMLRHAKKKVSLSRLKPGDLIFTSGGGHVGMYLGHKKVISAPHSGAVVSVDRLNAYWRGSFLTAVRPGV
ncbi:C40 family peptidase [Microbispora hainanensis]|uniref:C40 family peptidase n=1 Tax=Microbispora hainanensis TaxID=568844 RepID=UPI0033EF812C